MKTYATVTAASRACAKAPGGFASNRVVETQRLGHFGHVFVVVSRTQWPTGAPEWVS